jgi:hypothetical protein
MTPGTTTVLEPRTAGNDDPFHDPLMHGIAIVALFVTILIFALTGLMHWGVSYHSPGWSSHAVPPAVVH